MGNGENVEIHALKSMSNAILKGSVYVGDVYA